jgi:hypothetical protein
MGKHPIPDEVQAAWLLENGISPVNMFVVHDGGDYLLVQNYNTGDEIVIRRNKIKKREVAS